MSTSENATVSGSKRDSKPLATDSVSSIRISASTITGKLHTWSRNQLTPFVTPLLFDISDLNQEHFAGLDLLIAPLREKPPTYRLRALKCDEDSVGITGTISEDENFVHTCPTANVLEPWIRSTALKDDDVQVQQLCKADNLLNLEQIARTLDYFGKCLVLNSYRNRRNIGLQVVFSGLSLWHLRKTCLRSGGLLRCFRVKTRLFAQWPNSFQSCVGNWRTTWMALWR